MGTGTLAGECGGSGRSCPAAPHRFRWAGLAASEGGLGGLGLRAWLSSSSAFWVRGRRRGQDLGRAEDAGAALRSAMASTQTGAGLLGVIAGLDDDAGGQGPPGRVVGGKAQEGVNVGSRGRTVSAHLQRQSRGR